MEEKNSSDKLHTVESVQKSNEDLSVSELLKQLEMRGHKVELLEGSFGPSKPSIDKQQTIDKQTLKNQLKEQEDLLSQQ